MRYYINSTVGTKYNVVLTEICLSLFTTSVESRILMKEHNYIKQEMSKMPLYYFQRLECYKMWEKKVNSEQKTNPTVLCFVLLQ